MCDNRRCVEVQGRTIKNRLKMRGATADTLSINLVQKKVSTMVASKECFLVTRPQCITQVTIIII